MLFCDFRPPALWFNKLQEQKLDFFFFMCCNLNKFVLGLMYDFFLKHIHNNKLSQSARFLVLVLGGRQCSLMLQALFHWHGRGWTRWQ